MTAAVRRRWTLEEEPLLRGLFVHWVAPEGLLVSQRETLYRTGGVGAPLELVGRAPAPRWRSVASRLRAAERLLRFSYNNVVALPDGRVFFTFDKGVGIFDERPAGSRRRGVAGSRYRGAFRALAGLVRPTRVMSGGCAVDDAGDLYFGEYMGNRERHEMLVYRLPAGAERLEVVHTFPAGTARHVHGVYHDPFAGCLWCVTGDRPPECRVLRTFDRFRTLETVGEGDESWRTVALVFTERSVHYGSDGEFTQNYLYRIDRATGERSRLSAVDGPVYYAQSSGEDLFFGVTAELCPSQSGRSGALWHLCDGEQGACIATREKDGLPVTLFQPGTWKFSGGPGARAGGEPAADGPFVHVIGLRGGDNRTYRLRAR